jgi:microcompartment protein CcmK/EutM
LISISIFYAFHSKTQELGMQLGKVVGTVVSTKKDEKLEGLKFLIVKYINLDGSFTGGLVVAIDSVGAGLDEIVLVAAGSSARQTNTTKDKPVDTVIMAIVDHLEVNGESVYVKN